MTKTIQFTANKSMLAKAERKMISNEEHLVVPVVAIVEGVLNNLLYTSDEIKTFASSWNGVPVPVNHPVKKGANVSANSVEFEESVNIGKFFNVNFDDVSKSLKGEIWININKAESLGYSSIVESLEAGELMEVSTGLFSNQIEEAGEFNGNSYTGRAVGIRPDHLALLPDTAGACSIEDGCGAMRTNCGEDSSCSCGPKTNVNKSFWSKFKTIIGLKANEVSHDNTRSSLGAALRELIGDEPWPYIVDVFPSYFVYEVSNTLMKRSYSIDGTSGLVTHIGESSPVVMKTEYAEISTNKTTMKPNENAGSAVDAILANGTSLTAEEQTALKALPEELLKRITANKSEQVEKPVVPVATNSESQLSEADRALLDSLKANEEIRVNNLRASVVASYPNLGEEVVANMDAKAVQSLYDAAPSNTADRSAAAGAPVVKTNEGEEEYKPIDVFAEMVK